MKIKLDKTDSKVIHSNETYDVLDNTDLNNLIVSKTILHPGKETGGHNHSGQEEVYIFTKGKGTMIVGTKTYEVKEGDIIEIPKEAKHRVENEGKEDLIFIETQVGTYFGEDDIVRLEDDYGRNKNED